MARLWIVCKHCKMEVEADALALLEGRTVLLGSCNYGHIGRVAATIQEAALITQANLGIESPTEAA